MRRLGHRPHRAVLLFEDETILRLLPELRRAWSLRGHQGLVPISGRNAKSVLFGALNPRSGHRIVAHAPAMRQECFQAFLRLLRRAYRGREVWLVLDRAASHVTPKSKALAASLNLRLFWLPKQCSELNALEQLWRGLKADISANYQFKNIGDHAAFAQRWILSLSKGEALRKAGVLSKDFWLKPALP